MKNSLLLNCKELIILSFTLLILSACSSSPKLNIPSVPTPIKKNVTPIKSTATVNLPKANSGKGGYYQDDGPGEDIPVNLEESIDPIPVVEPYSRSGNKPYTVFGETYTPITDTTTPFVQRGYASWYGKKFHGRRTSSGEKYDMYKITAAHPTLPIPSYARVTNLNNGKQIIVRINDRGPFHSSRIMDLSYTAALKLDYLAHGKAEVEVERLLPEDIQKMAENREYIVSNKEEKFRNASLISDVELQKSSLALDQMIANKEKELINSDIKYAVSKSDNKLEYYLQYGAFALRENANSNLIQLQKIISTFIEVDNLNVIQQGTLYRVQSGPYQSRELAQNIANRVTLGGVNPIIVVR
jgi:rare lipoprotein A